MATIALKNKGFTLVELLIGTTIFAVIMTLLLQMLNAFEATSDLSATKKRLETIADKAGEYYLSRENLPVPNSTVAVPAPMGEVPLTDLHLEAKYRVDPWGRPIHYFAVRNDGEGGRVGEILIDPLSTGAPAGAPEAMVVIPQADQAADPPTGKTLIKGILVNGRTVAGILISSGPDNVFEYTVDTDVFPVPFVLNEGSDDIIVAIDVTLQATTIAQAELKTLGEKVRAFDDRYLGKNNDGDLNGDGSAIYDEDSCNANAYPGIDINTRQIGQRANNLYNEYNVVAVNKSTNPALVCANFPFYPPADYLPDDGNDYSCGRPTLDYMQNEFCDTSLGNCALGYYLPDEEQIDYAYDRVEVYDPVSGEMVFDHWEETLVSCGFIQPDYYRVPIDRGNPQPDECHWGLVGNPAIDPNLLTNDQTRAFIFCIYGLSPADIVDPWLNGYTWGSGTNYPDPDSRYQKFFSAGPDGTLNTDDDIVAPL